MRRPPRARTHDSRRHVGGWWSVVVGRLRCRGDRPGNGECAQPRGASGRSRRRADLMRSDSGRLARMRVTVVFRLYLSRRSGMISK